MYIHCDPKVAENPICVRLSLQKKNDHLQIFMLFYSSSLTLQNFCRCNGFYQSLLDPYRRGAVEVEGEEEVAAVVVGAEVAEGDSVAEEDLAVAVEGVVGVDLVGVAGADSVGAAVVEDLGAVEEVAADATALVVVEEEGAETGGSSSVRKYVDKQFLESNKRFSNSTFLWICMCLIKVKIILYS